MLDISESMDFFNKLLFSIKEILRFFDEYMEKEDKIGFMRFNQQFFIDFELQTRGEENMFLRNTIQKAIRTKPIG